VIGVPDVGLLPPVTAILTDGVTLEVTLIVIPFEVAVVVLAHVALEVITQVTIAPFAGLL